MAFTLEIATYTTAKSGSDASQNEDAAVVSVPLLRVAVADGASEGWGSGPWASTLANAFIATPPTPTTFAEWLTAVRVNAPKAPTGGSWYVEAKQELGAFSTLLGLSFEESTDGGIKWRAVAVGDTCVIHTRNGKRLAAVPIESASEFTNRPSLIGSNSDSLAPHVDWFAGRANLGDVFYVVTDALAEWVLQNTVSELETNRNRFTPWIGTLRDAKRLKNDDTTLVRIGIASI